MSIPPLESAALGNPVPARAPKQVMDGEVFLQLLVTQLANQDPSSPMDTNQMISQTAQLASMERLNTMASSQQAALDIQQRTAAAALLGQQVTTAGDAPLTGIVESVSFVAGDPLLTVNGQQVQFSQVAAIAAAAAGDATRPEDHGTAPGTTNPNPAENATPGTAPA